MACYKVLENGITPSVAIDLSMLQVKESRDCPVEPPASCGLEWQPCTNDPNACCPDYYCEYINEYYSRCRTDPNAGCLAENSECTKSSTDCCFAWHHLHRNSFYRQCVRN